VGAQATHTPSPRSLLPPPSGVRTLEWFFAAHVWLESSGRPPVVAPQSSPMAKKRALLAKARKGEADAPRVRLACERLSRQTLVLTSGHLRAHLRGGNAARAQVALRGLCKQGDLVRLGNDRYVANHLRGTLRRHIPTHIFPWWGSKRKHVVPLVSIIQEERRRMGKSRAVTSPFTGTGVVEGTLRNLGVRVRAFDLDPNVVNMHRALSTEERRAGMAVAFAKEVSDLRRRDQKARRALYKKRLRDGTLKSKRTDGHPTLAVRWNLGMRCSYLGKLRASSTFVSSKLQSLRAASVAEAFSRHRGIGGACSQRDVFTVLKEAPRKDLIFLDPPYLLAKAEGQYEAGDFCIEQHSRLARALAGRHFVLCHREDPAIRALYADWCEVLTLPSIMNITREGKKTAEMVIVGRGSKPK